MDSNVTANTVHPPTRSRRSWTGLTFLLLAMACLNLMGFLHRGKTFNLGFPLPFATWRLPFEDELPDLVFGPCDIFGYVVREFDFQLLALDLMVCFGMPVWIFRRSRHRRKMAAERTTS